MNYEQKYNELIKSIKKLRDLNPSDEGICNWVNDNVPELAESEDNVIKKELCKAIWTYIPNEEAQKYISWLEKRCEQKPKDRYTFNSIPRLLDMIQPTDRAKSYCQKLIDSLEQEGYSTDAKIVRDCLKQMNGEKVAMATMDEHNTDKVEPKFNEGNWIVDNCGYVWKIERITNRFYVLKDVEECESQPTIEWIDKTAHLWTIHDAKDGDILVASDESIFIYAGSTDRHAKFYAALTKNGRINVEGGIWEDKNSVHPATKEQHDILFQKMCEAGYEWNDDEKKLKITDFSKHLRYDPDAPSIIEEEPTSWSEDDNKMFEYALDMIEWYHGKNKEKVRLVSDWLKSIKYRVQSQKQWKPSEEQMNALEHFVRSIGESGYASPYDANLKLVHSLLNDLKKLKEL